MDICTDDDNNIDEGNKRKSAMTNIHRSELFYSDILTF